jgi:hypothetical protein
VEKKCAKLDNLKNMPVTAAPRRSITWVVVVVAWLRVVLSTQETYVWETRRSEYTTRLVWPLQRESNMVYLVGWLVYSRAVDPDSLNPDTDQGPAFQVNPIWIKGFYDQKLKEKKSAENFDYLF